MSIPNDPHGHKAVATVRRYSSSVEGIESVANPQTAITIAIDTAYVVGAGTQQISTGVYMFDNRKTNGSSGEGTLELRSKVNSGDCIGFQVVPIDPNTNDTVVITGFQVSQGSVFGSAGYPMQKSKDGKSPPDGSYWIGQAVNSSPQTTYQIQVKVTTGGLRPITAFIQWDPFIGTD